MDCWLSVGSAVILSVRQSAGASWALSQALLKHQCRWAVSFGLFAYSRMRARTYESCILAAILGKQASNNRRAQGVENLNARLRAAWGLLRLSVSIIQLAACKALARLDKNQAQLQKTAPVRAWTSYEFAACYRSPLRPVLAVLPAHCT